MLEQLIPLLVLAGIFSFYGIAQVAKAYWYDSAANVAEEHFDYYKETPSDGAMYADISRRDAIARGEDPDAALNALLGKINAHNDL